MTTNVNTTSTPRVDRRRFLSLSAGAATAVAASGLLTACGGSTGADTQKGGAGSVRFPAYKAATPVKPALPATADGVMAGFYDYPADPVRAFSAPPGKGLDSITAMTSIVTQVPPGVGSNTYWQALNKQLGADLKLTMARDVDYPAKLSTVISGGDLPDMMLISAKLSHRADVLTRTCADLSEFVSGSAIKEFPFLANIPHDAWLSTAYGGGIYAIPIPRAVVGTIMFARTDLIRKHGLDPSPSSYAEFAKLAKDVSDDKAHRWAFGSAKYAVTFIGNTLGVPNGWREKGGRFTSEYETEQRKEALARAAELAKAGTFHPDAMGNKLQIRDLFGNGTLVFNSDGYAAWDLLADTYGIEVGTLAAPKYDGGGVAGHRAGATSYGITAFKKADKKRVRQLLKVCDWLASPLGTREYMFRRFGVEGTHYTMKDGRPAPTKTGKAEVALPLEYIAASPHVLGPGDHDRVDAQRAYQEKVVPSIVRNPSEGLYSPTAVDKAGEMGKVIDQAELDIVFGRKPVSSWDETVKEWRRAGGDAARREYEKAFAARN
ncbi:extracellular solute-binding protein [Streptomyces fractus]|uniref:extracellular solute-binding protein n=1 Tax=Streptomyces fractus TaxID=641806 RepID=UPI003CF8D30B